MVQKLHYYYLSSLVAWEEVHAQNAHKDQDLRGLLESQLESQGIPMEVLAKTHQHHHLKRAPAYRQEVVAVVVAMAVLVEED